MLLPDVGDHNVVLRCYNYALLLTDWIVSLRHIGQEYSEEDFLTEINNKNVNIKSIQIEKESNIRYKTLFDLQERSYMQIARVELEFSSSVLLISGE